jgi:hypothetical protein
MCTSELRLTIARPGVAPFRVAGRAAPLPRYPAVQLGQATQAAQVVVVVFTLVQIWTPAAPLPGTVHSLTACSMQGQVTLLVLSL